jgi:hypothetical protein
MRFSHLRRRKGMSKLSRRDVLRATSLASGLVVLSACGATPTPQVIKEVVTQVVEKEVTKIVEGTAQVVVETVVVEVEKEVVVTATAEATSPPAAAQPVTIDIWIQQYSVDVMKGSAEAYSEAHSLGGDGQQAACRPRGGERWPRRRLHPVL